MKPSSIVVPLSAGERQKLAGYLAMVASEFNFCWDGSPDEAWGDAQERLSFRRRMDRADLDLEYANDDDLPLFIPVLRRMIRSIESLPKISFGLGDKGWTEAVVFTERLREYIRIAGMKAALTTEGVS